MEGPALQWENVIYYKNKSGNAVPIICEAICKTKIKLGEKI
jgi:hypothetical protein